MPTVITADPSIQMRYSNHAQCGTENNACTVPAGKRLVIEQVSGSFVAGTSNFHPPTEATLMVINGVSEHFFVGQLTSATVPASLGGSFAVYVFSTPFKLVLDSGSIYYWKTDRVVVTGYLIN
jgi:hypothetical protein